MTESEHKRAAYKQEELIEDAAAAFRKDRDLVKLHNALEAARVELQNHLGIIHKRISNLESYFPARGWSHEILYYYKEGFETFITNVKSASSKIEVESWRATILFNHEGHDLALNIRDLRETLMLRSFDFEALSVAVGGRKQRADLVRIANDARELAAHNLVEKVVRHIEEIQCPV